MPRSGVAWSWAAFDVIQATAGIVKRIIGDRSATGSGGQRERLVTGRPTLENFAMLAGTA
jgi:hypothetical protein